MTAQVSALKQAGVKAVVISAGPRQAASLVGVAAATGFKVPVVGNNSAYAPQLLATQAGAALQKDYYIGASTLPIGDAAEGPAKLAKAYAAQYPKDGLDNGVIAGYNAASVFGEALKKACASKDLTREGVDKALLTIKDFGADFGIVARLHRPGGAVHPGDRRHEAGRQDPGRPQGGPPGRSGPGRRVLHAQALTLPAQRRARPWGPGPSSCARSARCRPPARRAGPPASRCSR